MRVNPLLFDYGTNASGTWQPGDDLALPVGYSSSCRGLPAPHPWGHWGVLAKSMHGNCTITAQYFFF